MLLTFQDLENEHEDQRLNLAHAASMFDIYLQSPRVHQCLADTDDSGFTDQSEALFVILSFCHPNVGRSPEFVDWKLQHKFVPVVSTLMLFAVADL